MEEYVTARRLPASKRGLRNCGVFRLTNKTLKTRKHCSRLLLLLEPPASEERCSPVSPRGPKYNKITGELTKWDEMEPEWSNLIIIARASELKKTQTLKKSPAISLACY
ncbi:hypothetical protein PHET_08795 [Paragonimus heterotremus]|uniref:Uncharacterized protein n=1 Tax=Paragonimus heterotremus TaxID=100268 RepID=A0A8J4T6T8_9TREM|nr:hypothetical protein PHET_08795 [Paragonimus heterotremus]